MTKKVFVATRNIVYTYDPSWGGFNLYMRGQERIFEKYDDALEFVGGRIITNPSLEQSTCNSIVEMDVY